MAVTPRTEPVRTFEGWHHQSTTTKRTGEGAIEDLDVTIRRMKETYPAIFDRRTKTFSGSNIDFLAISALDLSDAERHAIFERLWEMGGFAPWVGGFNDILVNEATNRAAYDFWREKTRARIKDPAVAEILARGDADLVAFGRFFTSNADLPERLRRDWPLTPYRREAFWGGDERWYSDFQPYRAAPDPRAADA